MADGSWSALDRTGSSVWRVDAYPDPARKVPGYWKPPSAHVRKARSWQRISATVISRAGGEGFFRSDQHLIVHPMSDYGRATVQVEGGSLRQVPSAAPRVLSFRPAGVGLRTVISAPEYTYAAIFQDPATYRDLAAEVSAPISLADLEPNAAFEDAQAAALVDAIVDEIDAGTLDHLLVDALNVALAVQVARYFLGPAVRFLRAGRLPRQRLQRVLDHIEAHLASLSLDDLAAVACLSPFHFSRCFKRTMGVGPHRYVMGRRIERARHLILNSDMPLTDIADAVGFDSQASFTSRFGQELGVSPGRLRRETA